MGHRLASVALVLASACSGGGSGGGKSPTSCASSDLECFLSSLTVQVDGASVQLRTIDASALTAVHPGTALPSIWAVGKVYTGGMNYPALLSGWDGSAWTAYTSPLPSTPLTSVWAFTPDDAWAGGNGDTILHWDGTAWSVATPAGLPSTGDSVVGLWGASANDLWAITAGGYAAHYTGTWSSYAAIVGGDELDAIWGFSASDIWAVGHTTASPTGFAVHYDGTAWTRYAAGLAGFSTTAAIWGASSTDIWLAGTSGNGAGLAHWNGSAWAQDSAATSVVSGINGRLWLTGTGSGDVWLSGYNISGNNVARYNGSTWTLTPPVSTSLLQGGPISATTPQDAWMAAGFWHWNGTTWTMVSAPHGTDGQYAAIRAVPAGPAAVGAPEITNSPPALLFTSTTTGVDEPISWSDPSRCRPAFCFSFCSRALECSTSARCSSPVHDGLIVGSVILTLGYTAVAADGPGDFTLEVTPVAEADCKDPLDGLVAGTAGPLVGTPIMIDQTLVTPPTMPTGGGSIVGSWKAVSTTTEGAATTMAMTIYTFTSSGTDVYNSVATTTYTDGTPTASSMCTADGTYTTQAGSITITTPAPPADCGTILSPYTTTYSITGTMLTFGGDPAIYYKQ